MLQSSLRIMAFSGLVSLGLSQAQAGQARDPLFDYDCTFAYDASGYNHSKHNPARSSSYTLSVGSESEAFASIYLSLNARYLFDGRVSFSGIIWDGGTALNPATHRGRTEVTLQSLERAVITINQLSPVARTVTVTCRAKAAACE